MGRRATMPFGDGVLAPWPGSRRFGPVLPGRWSDGRRQTTFSVIFCGTGTVSRNEGRRSILST